MLLLVYQHVVGGKIIWVSRGGGGKKLWFKGGAHKKKQDYRKYSGKILPPVDVYSAF